MADSKWHTLKPTSDLRLLIYGFGALLLARGPWAAVILVLWSTLLATCYPAEAQQPPKSPRIGFLTAGSPSTIAARIDALREGLRELGYVEGKNILIEWRFAEGNPDRLPALMTELVRLNVDVIVSAGAAVTRPGQRSDKNDPDHHGSRY